MNTKPETQNTTFMGASKLHNDCICRFKMTSAPYQNLNYFFDNVDKCLDVYSTYERVVLAADLSAKVGERSFDFFTSTRTYFHKQ